MEKKVKDDNLVPNLNANERYNKGKSLDTMWVVVILTLLIGAGILAAYMVTNEDAFDDYKTYKVMAQFGSNQQLNYYLKDRMYCGYYYGWEDGVRTLGAPDMSPNPVGGMSSTQKTIDYSKTNIQVEGVDEADIVKTDGTYLYVASDKNVTVLKAYPAGSAGIVSKIEFENDPVEMYLNGDRLVVFENAYITDPEAYCAYNPEARILIFDVAEPSSPELVQDIRTDGYYFNSRMISDYVYVVVSHNIDYVEDTVILPEVRSNDATLQVKATEVNYFEPEANYYTMTIVLSINVKTNSAPRYDVYLTDAAQDMYASLENIYLTNTVYEGYYSERWDSWQSTTEKTWIHKIAIESGTLEYVQSVRVPGHVLNQFSMDEHEGYFRIATTTGESWDGSSTNNLYVMSENLNLTGRLEGLAKGESIYSARFMGDRCYLVTFKKIDPFFVIDLSNPESPAVLGELKIPGYSDYLHPYDENHVIGIGKEAYDMGDFAWYQGVKMSLFDVTDVKNPKEVSKYNIGDRGTDSYALNDHKAFLFSKTKNLLIIPILLAEVDEDQYGGSPPPEAYGEYVWQGAYVFSLSLEDGFVLKGKISHLSDGEDLNEYWWESESYVKRSLYIENNIYTVSGKMVKINDMDSMAELKAIEL